jgi:hypothetical protein
LNKNLKFREHPLLALSACNPFLQLISHFSLVENSKIDR